VHAVLVAQATPWSLAKVTPAGLGVACTVQAEPFQRSASVSIVEPVRAVPTAVQAVGEVHDTAFRTPFEVEGNGTDWIAQVVPFHASTSIRRLALLLK
jgi:hypothetical protein